MTAVAQALNIAISPALVELTGHLKSFPHSAAGRAGSDEIPYALDMLPVAEECGQPRIKGPGRLLVQCHAKGTMKLAIG